MGAPVQITFRDIKPSETISETIRRKAAKLDQLYDRITGCRVVISMPHRHNRKGRPFHVSIHLGVPGNELVVSNQGDDQTELTVAIRDAFAAARREVQDFSDRRRDAGQ